MVRTLIFFAWSLHDQGQFEEAQEHIIEALEIERDTQRQIALVEDMLHLGRIAMALHNLDDAERWIQQVVYYLERQGVQGIEHPALVYLTCYYILQAAGHNEQANRLLLQGYQFIISQAQQLEDTNSRQSYLTHIPEHQQLKTLATKPAKIS